MKRIKRNQKGMTLVEVVISMCILGAIAAMFVTIAVEAKKKNLDTYRRSNEMYTQAAYAENFNTDVKYDGDVKVSRLMAGSTNKYTIGADFGTINLEAEAYGYKAERTNEDNRDTRYRLRFFRSEYASLFDAPDPENGKFIIKIYNDSGEDIDGLFLATPTIGGGTWYTDEGPAPGERTRAMANGACFMIGLQLSSSPSSIVFTMSQNPGINDPSHTALGDYSFDESAFESFLEVKGGRLTGYAIFHICPDGSIKNQSQFEEMTL